MIRTILFTFCLLAQVAAMAQQDSLENFIRSKADSLLKADKLPGLFVGVMNGGQRRYFSFGYAIPDEKQPFDSATVFEAGSITKTFTAYAVVSVLAEKGIADTASVFPFLPDSVKTNTALATITFRSLLNHTSGLPRLPANLDLQSPSPYDKYTEADLFAFLKNATLTKAGTYAYSNLGAGLAGVLAQHISGRTYKELLQQSIFGPFGIRQQGKTRKAQGYFQGEKSAFWNMDALAPAGDLDCTAGEMLDYLGFLSKPSKKLEGRVAMIEKPTVRISPRLQIGLGWHLLEEEGKPTIYWHNGGTYGFSTFAAYCKGTGQAVVIAINRFNANNDADYLGIALVRRLLK